MKLYSIGELEVLSQIKAHTIRIWEQRYNLLEPTRSEGNTRYYSEDQLMKLLNVALLNKSGVKISTIAKYSSSELTEKAAQVALQDKSLEHAVEQLMVASLNFDQKTIADLFDSYNQLYGVEDTFEKIVFPYLRVVGNLWVTGKITPGHEHFFSNLCKLKLFAVIDQLPLPETGKSSILLCLPEWDYHELGILYYHYKFRKAGYHCTYLGQAVPAIDVKQTAKTIRANYIITTFIGPTTPERVLKYIEDLLDGCTADLLVSGPNIDFEISNYNGRVTVYRSMDFLIDKFQLNTTTN
jgi:DNA-binding transcriptional MerR regulator